MDEQEKYLRDLEADTQAHVRKAQQRIRELERYRIAAVQGTPFPHHENAPATLNDPAAAAPAPAAAKVAMAARSHEIMVLPFCILTVNSKIRRVVNFTENTTLAHKPCE